MYMSWLVEWWEDEPFTEENVHSSVLLDSWEEEVLPIFMECVKNDLCIKARVTCFLGDRPYPTTDPVVLEYRP